MDKHTWNDLGNRLWLGIPHWIVTRLDGTVKRKEKNWLTFLITLMILVLSAASITNLSDRAYHHHGNFSAYLAGFGLAALVPLAVICAVYVDVSGWTKGGIWLIAGVFAIISAAIQVNIYAPMGLGLNTASLEAIAFGAGIPLAEILLATLDGILIQHFARNAQLVKAEEKQAELDAQAHAKADREEAERKELQRLEWQAERERKRQEWQAEQDRKAAEHAQKLELQRQKALSSVQKSVQKISSDTPVVQQKMDKNGQNAKGTMDDMLSIFQQEPDASQRDVARRIGRSPQTISNWLKELEGQKRVEVNGIVKVL